MKPSSETEIWHLTLPSRLTSEPPGSSSIVSSAVGLASRRSSGIGSPLRVERP